MRFVVCGRVGIVRLKGSNSNLVLEEVVISIYIILFKVLG